MAACRYGHTTIVKMLIDAGADVNDNNGDSSPLEIAFNNKHSNIFRILLNAGADVNHIIERQSFQITTYRNSFNDIAEGIEAGAYVNV